ncbi:MAG: PaaI family thioesterase [Pseudohongiellaceae bacterium]
MKLKPEDFGINSNYRHWQGDKAEDYIGPFFFVMQGENPQTAFRVQEHHCNAHDSLHGGVLMALADYTLCLSANGGESESVVTVSCSNEFVAPAFKGDLVEGRGELIRRGGSMVFSTCKLYVGDTVVLTSSAVIKRIRKK